MKTFSKDAKIRNAFEFRKTRIVCSNKTTGIGVMGGLGGPDGMRMECSGNLFVYEG